MPATVGAEPRISGVGRKRRADVGTEAKNSGAAAFDDISVCPSVRLSICPLTCATLLFAVVGAVVSTVERVASA